MTPANISHLQFMVDGEKLKGSESAEDLDLDDNDTIKVTW